MNRVENQLEDLRLHRGTLFPIVTRLRAMALASGPAITEEANMAASSSHRGRVFVASLSTPIT